MKLIFSPHYTTWYTLVTALSFFNMTFTTRTFYSAYYYYILLDPELSIADKHYACDTIWIVGGLFTFGGFLGNIWATK